MSHRHLAVLVSISFFACEQTVSTRDSSKVSGEPRSGKLMEQHKHLLLLARPKARIPEHRLDVILKATGQEGNLSSSLMVYLENAEQGSMFESGQSSAGIPPGSLIPPIQLGGAEDTLSITFEANGAKLGSKILVVVVADDGFYNDAIREHQKHILATSDVHVLLGPGAFPSDDGVATRVSVRSGE